MRIKHLHEPEAKFFMSDRFFLFCPLIILHNKAELIPELCVYLVTVQ